MSNGGGGRGRGRGRGGGRGRRGGGGGGGGVEQQRPPPPQPCSVTTGVHQRPLPPPVPSQAPSSSLSTLAEGVQAISISPATATSIDVTPTSTKGLRPPGRPGYGTAGRKCQVRANHFLVSLRKPNADLFHYDVTISPEVPSRAVNRKVLEELVRLHQESYLGGRLLAYDGRKNVYTAGALPFESKNFVVHLTDENQSLKRDREFKVTIRFAAKLDFFHLQSFLQGRQPDAPHETIQLLDVVLRAKPSNKYVMGGRSFFSIDFGGTRQLGRSGVECWFGYYQSLRPAQMGLSLNIDFSATSFYEPISVRAFIEKNLNTQYIGRPMPDVVRIKLKKILRGVKIFNHHNKIRYRINGVSTEAVKNLRFTDSNNVEKSVAQYFREKYGMLECVEWPCLQAGSASRPAYLPIEVCVIVPGQKYVKKLSDVQVRDMLAATCQRPHDRERKIGDIVGRNNYMTDGFVQEFGLHVSTVPTTVDARVLPTPMLNYCSMDGRPEGCTPASGSWNMINKKMVNGGNVAHWACLNFSRKCNNADTFFTNLINKCRNMGMVFSCQPLINLTQSAPERCEATLRRIRTQCVEILSSQPGQHLQLLIIILPDFSGYYGRVKKICETELGIVSQCCQPSKVAKCNVQYLENVALKINVKVGGRNTVLNDFVARRWPMVTQQPIIVFGADVTHPKPGEDSIPSIAAVVASMDWPEVTKYRCLLSAQKHRVEIITDLYTAGVDPKGNVVHGGMIRDHLIAFRSATNLKPSRIIFYRDGVSEGQFNTVLLHEVDAIRKACTSLEPNYLPRITFVIVQKRHHTRLFATDDKFADRSGNVIAGTVVDTKICHPHEFDFYLCSHAGIKGTSRPTHYHVLFDENKFSADGLQVLTNNLCYTYARCTRSVSVVPPAYYAHLAAFRARYYFEGDSDVGSTSGSGVNVRERDAMVPKLPMILDNVCGVMFYC